MCQDICNNQRRRSRKLDENLSTLYGISAQDERHFYQFKGGKYVNQFVGKHTIFKIPLDIGTFLNIPNSKHWPYIFKKHSLYYWER